MKNTKILLSQSTLKPEGGACDIKEYLSSVKSVIKMTIATGLGFPAITGVVKGLEKKYGDSTAFPLNRNAKDKNATNRRSVGRMICAIMKEVGYVPKKDISGLSIKAPIPQFVKSHYFGTSIIYKKEAESQHCIKMISYICKRIQKYLKKALTF